MRARRKGTNTPYTHVEKVQLQDSDILYHSDVIEFNTQPDDFQTKEEILDGTYWNKVRNTAAIAAMQGILSHEDYVTDHRTREYSRKQQIEAAVNYANLLVEELKKK